MENYDKYILKIEELEDILFIYPKSIYKYFIYEITFYSLLNEDNNGDDRDELITYLQKNYEQSKLCADIKLGFILKSIKEDDILITIENTDKEYVGIITCKDMYPNNEFIMNLLCSKSKDKGNLNYSFGLLLQHILINYIYDNYEKDNENDDVYSIYLNAVENVHKYYLKLGYEYGSDCSNKHEYLYSNEEKLYPMKLCNLNKTLKIIYDKILIKLEESWKILPQLKDINHKH